MNIKFGMDNFFVKYLKRFLNNQLNQSSTLLGDFDKADQQSLISYLNLPNVQDIFSAQKILIEQFPEINTMFNINLGENSIIFTAKQISKVESNFIIDNADSIKTFCESIGWKLTNVNEWVDDTKDINSDGVINNLDREILYNIIFNKATYPENIMNKADLNLDGVINSKDLDIMDQYLNTGKLYFEVEASGRDNFFPNEDMLIFVNQFDGTFIYDYAIQDGIGIDNVPHYNATGDYKIALYKCKPGQKLTIAHNSANTVHLVIGSSPATLENDLTGFMLQNVQAIDLKSGEGFEYTVSSKEAGLYDGNWVCIQCPSSYGNISGSVENIITLEVGDINMDGRIDKEDYNLLARYTATGPGSEQLKWEATSKQKAVMDINKDGVIDNADTQILYKYINGDPQYPSLGLVDYSYFTSSDLDEGDNVSNLLIIQGHYPSSANIPFKEFTTDDWIVHDKFLNYLSGMAIHKYSKSENISYLQQLLKEYFPEATYDKTVFYPGNYSEKMKEVMLKYQLSKVSFTAGDLNRDGQLTEADVTLLSDYLEEKRLYFEANPELTVSDKFPSTILPNDVSNNYQSRLDLADVNKDGVINEEDLKILQDQINGTDTQLTNFDITYILGWCDVQTEALLENTFNFNELLSEVSK